MIHENVQVNIKRINLLITRRCNLNCKMCEYRRATLFNKNLTFKEITKLIGDLKKQGLERLELSGGEPMMRDDIYDIIKFAKNEGLKDIVMMTNGVLIGEEEAIKLCESGLTSVVFSLEGFKDVNDKIRGKGNFEKTIKAIEYIKKNISDPYKIKVNLTLSKQNYKIAYEFIKYLIEDLKIISISINPYNSEMFGIVNNNINEFYMGKQEIELLKGELEKIISYVKSKKVDFSSEGYLRKIVDYFNGEELKPVYGCNEPLNGCTCDSNGNIRGCWGINKIIGNIKEKNINEIIHSELYYEVCKKALNKNCEGCLNTCYEEIYS